MDQKQIAKQMIEFNKTIFDNTFKVITFMQDEAEKMFSGFLSKAPFLQLPDEGKKAIDQWINSYKKGREDFKAAVDENYKKIAEYFSNMQK